MHVWYLDAAATIVSICCSQEPPQQRQFYRLFTCGAKKVVTPGKHQAPSSFSPFTRSTSTEPTAPLAIQILTQSSTSSAPSSSNYDRPNRLKGREDGGIRWVELLEKFRSVQEKARRAQRQNLEDDDQPPLGVSELRIGDGTLDTKGKDMRSTAADLPSTAPKETAPAPAPAAPAKKSGLGRQFGRLGGAVSGKGRRG